MAMPTVKRIANQIYRIHKLSFAEKQKMFLSIPEEILNTKLCDENLNELMLKLDNIRFLKEEELAKLLDLNTQNKTPKTLDSEFLYRIINVSSEINLDFYRREIHFLLSVAASIIQL